MKQARSGKTAECKKRAGRILALMLSLCLLAPLGGISTPGAVVYAARIMRLSTAKSVAVARSEKIEALEIQVESKQAAIKNSVSAPPGHLN